MAASAKGNNVRNLFRQAKNNVKFQSAAESKPVNRSVTNALPSSLVASLSTGTKKLQDVSIEYAEKMDDGRLHCIVCDIDVKSVLVWSSHASNQSHLRNVEIYLNPLAKKQPNPAPKRLFEEYSDDEDEDVDRKRQKMVNSNNAADEMDLNEESPAAEETTENNLMDVDEQMADDQGGNPLPAGFFDDEEKDQKIRKNLQPKVSPVQSKGPQAPAAVLDAEWDLFQREIKQFEERVPEVEEDKIDVDPATLAIQETKDEILSDQLEQMKEESKLLRLRLDIAKLTKKTVNPVQEDILDDEVDEEEEEELRAFTQIVQRSLNKCHDKRPVSMLMSLDESDGEDDLWPSDIN